MNSPTGWLCLFVPCGFLCMYVLIYVCVCICICIPPLCIMMMRSSDEPPSPGTSDDPLALTTPGSIKDKPKECSQTQPDTLTTNGEYKDMGTSDGDQPIRPPRNRHQVDLGGVNDNMRVLYCPGIDGGKNYKDVYGCLEEFGCITRIKLRLTPDEKYFDGYITFEEALSAKRALEGLRHSQTLSMNGVAKLFDIRNLDDDDGDFVPKNIKNDGQNYVRAMAVPVWHIISCRGEHNNLIQVCESLEDQVGGIPDNNIKRYGKNLLIKAKHKSQAKLLTTFHPNPSDIIQSISPHRQFNTARGVVYSRDLYEFDESEILKRCPKEVLSVKL